MKKTQEQCFREDIAGLKKDMQWVKKIGYYLSGIITLQLIATITGKL